MKVEPGPNLQRVAVLAGISEEHLQNWLKVGLFEGLRATTGDWVARCLAIRQLERANVPLDVLVAANQSRVLERAYLFDFVSQKRGELQSREDVLIQTGIDAELLERLSFALGIEDTARFSTDEVEMFTAIVAGLRDGLPDALIIETCELWGAQMRQIASAEVLLYDTNLTRKVMSEAESPLEGAAQLAPLARSLMLATDQMAPSLHRRHLLQALELDFHPGVLAAPMRALGEVDVAIGFVDLSGYTALTEKEGDIQALTYARRLERIVRREALAGGPRIVKRLGDGLMLASPSAVIMLQGVLKIVETTRSRNDMPSCRAGISYGKAQSRAGDYFGHTVNVAARILTQAGPAEVLVTDQVADVAGGGPFAFREPRDVVLRGMAESVRLWRTEPLSSTRT